MKKTIVIVIVMILISKITYAQWTQCTTGILGTMVNCLANQDSFIYAGTYYGLYKITNNDTIWSNVYIDSLSGCYVTALAIKDSNIFMGTIDNGVYYSSNNGITWVQLNNGLPNNWRVLSIVLKDSSIYVVMNDYFNNSGIFLSTNFGQSWLGINNNLPNNSKINSIAVTDSIIYIGVNAGIPEVPLIYFSTNNGSNWNIIDTLYPPISYISSLYIFNSKLYVGTDRGLKTYMQNGLNWTSTNSGFFLDYYGPLVSFACKDSNIYVGTRMFESWADVFVLKKNDSIWVSTNLTDVDGLNMIIINGSYIYVGSYEGVRRSELSNLVNRNEIINEKNMTIYPNPASNEITIDIKDAYSKHRLEIINSIGQLYYQSIIDKKVKLNISTFPKDLYIFKIVSKQAIITKKVLIR